MRESMTKEERHQHILQTARLIFAEQGYDHVSIADVIKASNIARGTFYLHFSSMEDVLIALFEDTVAATWERIDPILSDTSISFEDCTMAVIHAVFAMLQEDESLGAVFHAGGGHAFLKRKQEIMYDELGDRLVRALEHRHHSHIPNAKWTVMMLIALIGDMAYYAAHHVAAPERKSFEQHAISFVLAGMREHLKPYVPLDTLN
jgi:AcrR family transcriptional regulator